MRLRDPARGVQRHAPHGHSFFFNLETFFLFCVQMLGMVMSDLEVYVLDELGSSLKFLLGSVLR